MISYTPWSLRGYPGKTWQVYVEITDSHSIVELITINVLPVYGASYFLATRER